LFNQKKDYEADFCESYKSQILGDDEREEGDSLFSTMVKLLTVLMLLAVIIGVSFYGYNYFMNSQKTSNIALHPVSMQTFDDDFVVKMEEQIETKKVLIK
jgi:zona occludens toxin (predicted ATPase)